MLTIRTNNDVVDVRTMKYLILLCLCLASVRGQAQETPSHLDLVQAIVANREKIRTVTVRTKSTRTSPRATINHKALYLDADAQRWRTDKTGLISTSEASTSEMQPEIISKVAASGGLLYRYTPNNPRMVAIVESLKNPTNEDFLDSLSPFPDPRNAGLVHVFHGNTGTPLQEGGTRIPIYKGQLEPHKGEKVDVEPETWKGMSSWKVTWEMILAGSENERCVRNYLVVPQFGYTVVLLESNIYRHQEAIPYNTYSVKTDVALHQETQIWFPTKVHYSVTVDGNKTQDEITEFELISLNEPIPESEFTFKGMGVPVGQAVVDFSKRTSNKIWDGDKVVFERRGPSLSSNEMSPVRKSLLLITAFFVFCLSIAVWVKGHQRKSAIIACSPKN